MEKNFTKEGKRHLENLKSLIALTMNRIEDLEEPNGRYPSNKTLRSLKDLLKDVRRESISFDKLYSDQIFK